MRKMLIFGSLIAIFMFLQNGFSAAVALPYQKSIIVDLSVSPKLPFPGATLETPLGVGTAKLERRTDGNLYVDGHKIILYLSEHQQNGKDIQGSELRKELSLAGQAGNPVLNANILDVLLANLHLIPENWKKDEHGNTRCIFFWGTIYRDPDGPLCVRFLFFYDGVWYWDYGWIVSYWAGQHPAAVLASEVFGR